MDFVQKVKTFNEIAGTNQEFNPKMVSLYMGLVLEESAEMLEALGLGDDEVVDLLERMNAVSHLFKCNEFEESILSCIDRVAFLDGAVDTAVVSIGAGISVGSDIEGACHEVADSNLTKYVLVDGDYVVLKDGNGKITKPPTYLKPELQEYLI